MTPRELVRSKLDADLEQPLDRLVEITELDRAQCADALQQLRAAGECKRLRDGWVLTMAAPAAASLDPEPDAARVDPCGCAPVLVTVTVPLEAPTTEDSMARPKKTAAPAPREKRKYTRRKAAAAVPEAQVAVGSAARFALSERWEIEIAAGGSLIALGAADAVRLAEFIAAVRPAFKPAR